MFACKTHWWNGTMDRQLSMSLCPCSLRHYFRCSSQQQAHWEARSTLWWAYITLFGILSQSAISVPQVDFGAYPPSTLNFGGLDGFSDPWKTGQYLILAQIHALLRVPASVRIITSYVWTTSSKASKMNIGNCAHLLRDDSLPPRV